MSKSQSIIGWVKAAKEAKMEVRSKFTSYGWIEEEEEEEERKRRGGGGGGGGRRAKKVKRV